MKIATFNINGVRARIETLTGWLTIAQPDVVVLQEIKTQDEGFPGEAIADLGYNIETHGQKGFNGVAILSKLPLEDISRGLPGDDSDEQARWIEATVVGQSAVRIAGLYLPNGNPQPGPKFDYKLAWMERLRAHAQDLLKTEMPTVMLGGGAGIVQRHVGPKDGLCRAMFLPDDKVNAVGFERALAQLSGRVSEG